MLKVCIYTATYRETLRFAIGSGVLTLVVLIIQYSSMNRVDPINRVLHEGVRVSLISCRGKPPKSLIALGRRLG